MTYATQDDLLDRYGDAMLIDLTDRAEVATGQIDIETVEKALSAATAEIDGYLAGRYALPVTVQSPILNDLACVLAIWRLHIHTPPEKIKADYEAAQKRLREIASGVFRLPLAGIEPAGTGASGARVTDRARPFTEQKLKGFI